MGARQLMLHFLQNAIDASAITGIICSMPKSIRKLLPIAADRLEVRLTLKGGPDGQNL
jgi:hypothetical protein